ncbi:hypothetical protein ACFL0T_01155 [Candidatus Omnitrophota bacterium]
MKRSYISRLLIITLIIGCVGLIGAAKGFAQEKAKSENKVMQFFKNVINWPFGITKKSSEGVARAVHRPTTMTTTTASSAVDTVTGKPEKIKDVVVEPIVGSAETAYIAVEGQATAPVDGTKDAFGLEEGSEQ